MKLPLLVAIMLFFIIIHQIVLFFVAGETMKNDDSAVRSWIQAATAIIFSLAVYSLWTYWPGG